MTLFSIKQKHQSSSRSYHHSSISPDQLKKGLLMLKAGPHRRIERDQSQWVIVGRRIVFARCIVEQRRKFIGGLGTSHGTSRGRSASSPRAPGAVHSYIGSFERSRTGSTGSHEDGSAGSRLRITQNEASSSSNAEDDDAREIENGCDQGTAGAESRAGWKITRGASRQTLGRVHREETLAVAADRELASRETRQS